MELFNHPRLAMAIIPALFLAILIEALFYPRVRGRPYPWREGALSIVIGIGHGLAGFINQAIVVAILAAAAWHYRLATIPMGHWWSWLILLFLEELAYYWYHRAAHQVRLLWATHSVHHSPNELTLTAAYRLAWTPVLSLSWIFFLPIIWIGFDPRWVFGLLALNLAYQFWLHTTLVPRLGFLEGVLNTPSAHRVHHGSNAEYLDRNFGGIVLLFDRLFGTYRPEDPAIPLIYGLVSPAVTENPLKIVYGEFFRLIRDLWRAASWGERGRLLFKPPGWQPRIAD